MSGAYNNEEEGSAGDSISPLNSPSRGTGAEDPSTGPKFQLGQTVVTPGALSAITQDEILMALRRHQSGDWGDLDDEDKATNDKALLGRDRIFSSYSSLEGTKFWVITEWDRSATTILLPSEY